MEQISQEYSIPHRPYQGIYTYVFVSSIEDTVKNQSKIIR